MLVVMRLAVTFVGMVLIAAVAALAEPAPAEAHPRYEVAAWYPGWDVAGTSDYQSLLSHTSVVDEVNPYWYALKPNGSIRSYDRAEDSKVLSLAREEGITLIPLITNEFDPDRVHSALSSPALRDAHIKQLVNLAVRKEYDGLEIDYESLYASDRDRFSLFIEELAARLHARDKDLSIAVHPKTSAPGAWSGSQAQDWSRIGRAVDEFKIMTYDYHWNGSRAGPTAPPGWVDEVLTFAESRIAPRKIRMGLPFYGRSWRGTEARDFSYTGSRNLIDRHAASVRRHATGEPYFRYPSGRTVYYQDPQSVAMKLDVLIRRHPRVGGIAIWHIGGESPKMWNPIENKLQRQGGP